MPCQGSAVQGDRCRGLWLHHLDTDRISCLVSLWATRLRGILDFGEIMAQIGLFLDNKLDFKKHLDEKIHKRNLNLNDGKTLPIGLKTKFINHL